MKKRKVLVTGGCGFVGREVVKQLLEKDYDVVIADNFSNSDSLEVSPSVEVIDFDLTKSVGVLDLFEDVDYCIHLAASVGGIKYMTSRQAEILHDDIIIDVNTIKAASLAKVKIVYASTVIIYDQSKEIPFKEDQVNLNPPKSNYGFSKLVGERLCQVFGKDKNLNYSIARISNVYGINQNKINEKRLHVVPDLIRKISQGGILKILNGGSQIRTFVHVSDLADALILMMENNRANGEIFNVGTKDRYQILEVAKMIWELLRDGEPFSYENFKFEGDDLVDSSANGSKIHNILGWEAKRNLIDSLPELVKWYSNEYDTKVS
ncbi:MAG: NAD(P)-dependent oxidoreductase [Candidatus Daviesbacteria bacterium]|nr:NAD(P)-dependent oxidoreductase [Candidatus Daviesbacteria bacterium]